MTVYAPGGPPVTAGQGGGNPALSQQALVGADQFLRVVSGPLTGFAPNLAPVWIGNDTRVMGTAPQVLLSQNWSDGAAAVQGHGFCDYSEFTKVAAAFAYAAFDARVLAAGALAYDHIVSFQSAPELSSVGGATTFYGLFHQALVDVGATLTNSYALYNKNPGGAGIVTNNFCVHSESGNSNFLNGFVVVNADPGSALGSGFTAFLRVAIDATGVSPTINRNFAAIFVGAGGVGNGWALGTVSDSTGRNTLLMSQGYVAGASGGSMRVDVTTTTMTFLFQKTGGTVVADSVSFTQAAKYIFDAPLDLTGAPPAAAAGHITFGGATRTTIGANGGATVLTALPLGYFDVNVAGVIAQVPFYNRGA